MKIIACIAVATISLGNQAFAQRQGISRGAGVVGCGEYLADRAEPTHQYTDGQYASWTMGYLSAYNVATKHPQLSTIPDSDTTLAYLDKFCRNNPLGYVIGGVNCLIGDLGGWKPDYCK